MPLNLILISSGRLIHSSLPNEYSGKHWLEDTDTLRHPRRLASIEAKDNTWILRPYASTTLIRKDPETAKRTEVKETPLTPGVYELVGEENDRVTLLADEEDTGSKLYTKLGYYSDITLTIGRAKDNIYSFDNEYVSSHHATLTLEDETFTLKDTGSANGVFLNDRKIKKDTPIKVDIGDTVFIMGLQFFIGKRFVGFNNPRGLLTVTPTENQVIYTPQEYTRQEQRPLSKKEKEPFFRSPRIMREITPLELTLEDPPQKHKKEESPAILKIGPSLGMALASAMMGLYMVSNIMGGQGSPMRALPMLGMMVVMILGAVLWPNLSRRYEKKKEAKEESKRRATYATYLDTVRRRIIKETALQKEILEENRITLKECLKRAETKDRRLYERTPYHPDFLELRIGRGNRALEAKLVFPPDKLTLDEDILKDLLKELEREKRELTDVPLTLDIVSDFISGIVA